MLLQLLISASVCSPPSAQEPVLFVVSAVDEALLLHRPRMEKALIEAAAGKLSPVKKAAAQRALSAEGGAEAREANLIKAQVLVKRAEERFRELDAEKALELIAKATGTLAASHQEEGAVALLARAHLLAGAIYLARGREDAAKQRLQRALDLDPKLSPARHRFAPEVLAELASIRAAQGIRPVGRLEVRLINEGVVGRVFVDGQPSGTTPMVIDALGAGRHLLRVSAAGYKSYIASVSITGSQGHLEKVNLARDREVSQIVSLPRILRSGADPTETLALLARRAGARRALLAAISLSSVRQPNGAPELGVELFLPGAGRAYAASPAGLQAALDQVLRCASDGPTPAPVAPSLLALTEAETSAGPVKPPAPFWNQPWFWGTAGLVTLIVATGLVAARTSQGPPESVQITLVPRP